MVPFSGVVKIPNAEATLDYRLFLDQGKDEKEKTLNELSERLTRMTPWELMKNQSEMNDQLMKVLKQKPLGFYAR